MKPMTKHEFFEEMSSKGSFENIKAYVGNVTITDDIDMNNAWAAFCHALVDLQDIYDDFDHSVFEEEDFWF